MEALADSISNRIAGVRADVGVAVISGTDTMVVNGDSYYPLMSVFKLHVAVAVLDMADRGLLSLDSIIDITPRMFRENTYSPLRDIAAGRTVSKTVAELLYYSVAKSDNNACDFLIDLAGGIADVDSVIHAKGIGDVTLCETEDSMHRDIMRSYNNASTPLSLSRMMSEIFAGRMLSAENTDVLLGLLGGSTTGRDKIYGGVPEDCFAGHKSGLSDRLPEGVLIASGDVAALRMPDGRLLFLAILVKDSHETDADTSALFRDIASMVYRLNC